MSKNHWRWVPVVCALACTVPAQDTLVTASPLTNDQRLTFGVMDGVLSDFWYNNFQSTDSLTIGGSGGSVTVTLAYGPPAEVIDQCRRGCGLFVLAEVSDDVFIDGGDELVISLAPTDKADLDTCTSCLADTGTYPGCFGGVPQNAVQYRLPLSDTGAGTTIMYDQYSLDCTSMQCSPTYCSPSMSGWETLYLDSTTRVIEFFLSWCDPDVDRYFELSGARFALNVGYIDDDGGQPSELTWVGGDPWEAASSPTAHWGEVLFTSDTVAVRHSVEHAQTSPLLQQVSGTRLYDLTGRRIEAATRHRGAVVSACRHGNYRADRLQLYVK